MTGPRPEAVSLAAVQADFPGWLCWPDQAGACLALQLRPWFRDGELYMVKATSPADLQDLLCALNGPAPRRCADQTAPALARAKARARRCLRGSHCPARGERSGLAGEAPVLIGPELRAPKMTAHRLLNSHELKAHRIGRSFGIPALALAVNLNASSTHGQASP
jgi:hypothetical protein